MLFRSKKNKRVDTVKDLIEEETKEAKEEDMDKEEEEDIVVVEEDHLPYLTVAK
jgi:hypothetical protein